MVKIKDKYPSSDSLPTGRAGKGSTSEQEQPVTDISIYIAALSTTYRPARTPAEVTHWFSTEEVVAAIKEFDPSAKVSSAQIFEALRQAGYEFCNRPGSQGMSFKWMFFEK